MSDSLPVTAASRSVALRFQPDSELLAGSFLRINTSPDASATARTVEGTTRTSASATARGLGAGYSSYYEGIADGSFFNSRNLSIGSGGGLIDGKAVASAYASGRGDTNADALATNIGLAQLNYLDRYGGQLLIGTTANPFAAYASAGSGSVLGPVAGTNRTTGVNAIATVRGVEGPSTLYGQPTAVVAAGAELQLEQGTRTVGSARADAVGLEDSLVKVVPFGNGDGTASLGGQATSTITIGVSADSDLDTLSLNGRAIGVENSTLYGAPTLNTTITGRGLASVEATVGDLQQLRGIGITNSQLFTNQGADVIRGFSGIAAPGLALGAPLASEVADTAGIDRTGMYTGIGDDVIFGKILNEVEAGLDGDGDGELEAAVFLDRSALEGSIGGFDGIRNSTANTGLGNDLIAGSSNGSHLYTSIGNDSIDLDRAKDSSLWGGIGNDLLRVGGADGRGGPSDRNVLWGGIGNDNLKVGSGSGSVLDGGYGQDITTGGSGVDRFVLSEGGAAIQAASSSYFGEDLADTPLWAKLSDTQKETLWETGRLVSTDGNQLLGSVDTIRDFQAGSGGDILELSNSLAGITQELWATKGAIFGVSSSGGLTVQEASADGTNKVGVVMGTLADIQRLGIGSPSIAYATDTRQLMFDADGNWGQGAISLGTVNTTGGSLTKSNFAFGSTTGNGIGEAPTAQGAV